MVLGSGELATPDSIQAVKAAVKAGALESVAAAVKKWPPPGMVTYFNAILF